MMYNGTNDRSVFCETHNTKHYNGESCEKCRFTDTGKSAVVVSPSQQELDPPIAVFLDYDLAWKWAHKKSETEKYKYYSVSVVPIIK